MIHTYESVIHDTSFYLLYIGDTSEYLLKYWLPQGEKISV